MFHGWIGDSDKDQIIEEHRSNQRPLGPFFEDVYLTVLQYRAQSFGTI
jgi:hypothetical protein